MQIERHILTKPQIEFVKFLGNRNISDKEIDELETYLQSVINKK